MDSLTATVGLNPMSPRRRFFTKQKKSQENVQHIGQENSIQTFFEAPNFNEQNPTWVEYAPPSIPQVKKLKQEGAAVQLYKRLSPDPGRRGTLYIFVVRLQSPFLRDALHDTLEKYGITYGRHNAFAESVYPHHGLFHALDKVDELAKTAGHEITRKHCGLLRDVIADIFDDALAKLETLESEYKITYDLLWTLFPPSGIFAVHPDSSPPRAYLVKTVYADSDRVKIVSHAVEFDGFRYGHVEYIWRVWYFDGAVDYANIPGLSYGDLSRDRPLRARLLERGRRALDTQTISYMAYNPEDNRGAYSPWTRVQDSQRVIVDPYLYGQRRGRKYITPLSGYNIRNDEDREDIEPRRQGSPTTLPKDTKGDHDSFSVVEQGASLRSPHFAANNKAFMANHKTPSPRKSGGTRHSAAAREEYRRPSKTEIDLNCRVVLESEDNLIIMNNTVYGYSIGSQTWGRFNVDNLNPVRADKTVFDKVVLDESKKDIIKTLVESHMEQTSCYDDLITGKGQCLFVVLSGPPGTGKTLMAESLAEHLGCPLLKPDLGSYRPDASDIKPWPSFLDSNDEYSNTKNYDDNAGNDNMPSTFAQFLQDATEWGGLVLIDEPEFLLQNQEASSKDRQSLLTFLRQAEYFKGIVFLTTNLAHKTIDPAVLSRAQIHVTFPALTQDLRVRVWQNFIDRLRPPSEKEGGLTLSAGDVAKLAKWRVNGREIKNILNMSVSWRRKKGEFSVQSVERLIRAICPSASREEDGVNGSVDGVKQYTNRDVENGFSLLEL